MSASDIRGLRGNGYFPSDFDVELYGFPEVAVFLTSLVQGCDSVDIDSATGVCAHPYWVEQVQWLPDLDAASGVAIGVAILTAWAIAYSFRSLRRVGD